MLIQFGSTREKTERFNTLSDEIPRDPTDLRKIVELADSLKRIRDGMQFQLPRSVLRFYDALDRDGHVPLSKLDDDTHQWLAENNGLKDLAIKRHRLFYR